MNTISYIFIKTLILFGTDSDQNEMLEEIPRSII
jgi:hypothetical protein